jgi:peptidoglycan/LPS O-acetylase OafA/YrhL
LNFGLRLGEKAVSRENNFDFLRFFAASQVILFHTFALSGAYSGPFWKAYSAVFKDSGVGVGIFFVISGFLITKSRLENPSLPVYLTKRFLRIMPALTASVAFCVLVVGPLTSSLSAVDYFAGLSTFQPHLQKTLKVLDGNHVPNMLNGSLWTLKVEAFAYMIVAAAGYLSLPRLRLFMAVTFISLMVFNAVMLGRPAYYEMMAWHIYVYLSIRYLILFIAGSLIYLYRDKIPLNFYLFLFLLSVMFLTQRFAYGEWSVFLALPYAVIYFAYSKAPLNRWGRFGDFSYGLYIFAFPVQQTLLYFWAKHLNNSMFFLSAFFVTFILAFLSWNLIEKPSLRLKGVMMVAFESVKARIQ